MTIFCHAGFPRQNVQTFRGKCFIYAIITERESGTSKTICAGESRSQHVYTTSSSVIEVQFFNKQRDEMGTSYFLIGYSGTEDNSSTFYLQWLGAVNCYHHILKKHHVCNKRDTSKICSLTFFLLTEWFNSKHNQEQMTNDHMHRPILMSYKTHVNTWNALFFVSCSRWMSGPRTIIERKGGTERCSSNYYMFITWNHMGGKMQRSPVARRFNGLFWRWVVYWSSE